MRLFTRLSLLSLLFFSFLTVNTVYAEEKLYFDINPTETSMINFAVPWFINSDSPAKNMSFGKDVADIMAKSLKFHGIIKILPTKQYGGSQKADLKKYGADYAVLGKYSSKGDALYFELKMVEVSSGRMIFGKKYNGNMAHKESMLYRFCDQVIYQLTGTKGIASTQIAFISNTKKAREAFVTDILGKKTRQITRHKALVISPRFTDDGKKLTYTSYHSGNPNLYITDLRQSKTTKVLSRRKGMNLAPAWSPDGKNLILTLSKNGNPDLYLLDNKGKIITQLTKKAGINVSPCYSPDGKKIVFVSDRSGKPQLYLMNLSTRKTQRLTFQGVENAEPSWSPKGDLITYSSLRNGIYQIYTRAPDPSATPKAVTKDKTHHESPSWSPDGNQIIFSKRNGKTTKIFSVMKNGSFQRQLFSLPGNQSYPQWAFSF